VASVSARANAWRRDRAPFRGLGRRLGPFTYPLATAVEILRGWEPVRVKIDGGGEPNPLAALVVSKQPRFGGSFRASPLASKTDGALHLCLIASPPTRRRMLWISLEILRGQGGRCPEVLNARGEKLTILAERDVRFYADGEPLAAGRSFRIEIRRGALPVVVPASYAGEEPSDAA
jgi:diacylglycerol kinase family enzyme